MSIDWRLVFGIAPFVIAVISIISLIISILAYRRVGKIFKNTNLKDFEDLVTSHTKAIDELVQFRSKSLQTFKSLGDRMKTKVGSVPTLRFNPFQGDGFGGNQSFSSVFADENGNGVIITSMHTRERTNIFAKPIKGWQSEYELSEEEKTTLNRAKQN